MPVSSGSPAAFHAAVPPASTLTGAPGGRSRRRQSRAIAPSSLVSTRSPEAGNLSSASSEAGADRKPRAGDVAVAMAAAQRQIDDDRRVARSSAGETVAGSGPASGNMPAVERPACRCSSAAPSRPRSSTAASQPMRLSHEAVIRARTPVSSTSTTRAPQIAEPAVGLLHQLPARRHQRARQVAGAVFGRVADIEHVERAPVGLALPFGQAWRGR